MKGLEFVLFVVGLTVTSCSSMQKSEAKEEIVPKTSPAFSTKETTKNNKLGIFTNSGQLGHPQPTWQSISVRLNGSAEFSASSKALEEKYLSSVKIVVQRCTMDYERRDGQNYLIIFFFENESGGLSKVQIDTSAPRSSKFTSCVKGSLQKELKLSEILG